METKTINKFSLYDILNLAGVSSGINAIAITDSTKLTELLSYYGFALVQGVFPFNPETDEILIKFINGFVKVRDDLNVVQSENDLANTNKDILNGFLEKFLLFLNKTYSYYSQLISLYEAKKSQLMNDLTYSITKSENNSVVGSGTSSASGTSGNTRTDALAHTDENTKTNNLQGTSGNTKTNALHGTKNNTKTDTTGSTEGVSDMPQTTAFSSSPSTDDTLTKLTQKKNSGTLADVGDYTDEGTITDSGTTSDTGTVKDAGSSSDTGTVTDAGTTSDNSQTNTNSTETKAHTETRTDPSATIAIRLKEVENNIQNYYSRWYEQFVKTFVIY